MQPAGAFQRELLQALLLDFYYYFYYYCVPEAVTIGDALSAFYRTEKHRHTTGGKCKFSIAHTATKTSKQYHSFFIRRPRRCKIFPKLQTIDFNQR